MKEYKEFVFQPDGRCIKRYVTEAEITVNESDLLRLSADVPIEVGYPFKHRGQNVKLTVVGHVSYYSWTINPLIIRAPFRLVRNILVPNFDSKTDTVLTLNWTPPEYCLLRFVAQVSANTVGTCWLFAVDLRNNKTYKMPLANLYDDGKLCMGVYDGSGLCHAECLEKASTQLDTANWNKDLWSAVESTQKMFRWEPENDSFNVLDPKDDWTTLCLPIVNSMKGHLP